MRKFYNIIRKGATLWHQLNLSHYRELISFNDIDKINYYINICKIQNLSVRKLRNKIKNNEYEKIDEKLKTINQDKTIGILHL